MTDAVIVAILGLFGSVIVSLIASRIQAQGQRAKTVSDAQSATAALFHELCEGQQARIDQLVAQLKGQGAEIICMRKSLAQMQADNILLTTRIRELERENAELKEEIAKLRGK